MAKKEQTPQRRAPDRPVESPRNGDGALQNLIERVLRTTAAEWAGVASFSPAQLTMRWMAGSDGAQDLTRWITGETLRRLAASSDPVVLERISLAAENSSERAVLLPRRAAPTNLLLIPLRARGELIGALCVAGARGAEQESTLANLAELTALTLDNVLLRETVGAAQRAWEQTFDALTDGIIVFDDQSRIVRCNLRAAQVLGLASPPEAVGLSEKDSLVRLFGKRAAAYHSARRAGEASSFELQSAGGARYLVTMAPLQLAADKPSWSVLTWSDVTELSAMQEQLSRTRRLALAGQLAAGVAHEINNPLAAITTCAETMLLDLSEGPEFALLAQERDWIFYLEEIVRQALRGKGVTQGLLDLSRQRSADLRPCDVNLTVAQCAKLYEQKAGERVSLKTECEPQLAPVLTDEAMLRQILDNLLRNALDALEHGAGVITVSTARADDRVIIAVADTGPGIPAELVPRLFEPFYTTKEVGRGSGLGLAISSALAESLGGALTVESKEGAGSCFRLSLPYRPASPSDD